MVHTFHRLTNADVMCVCGRDYAGWGDVIGRLAAQYPHLVALEIDDMTHDIAPAEHGIFTLADAGEPAHPFADCEPRWDCLLLGGGTDYEARA